MKRKRIEEMNKIELCNFLYSEQHSAREYREIHKALKKYGDGLCLKDRYPQLPLIVSATALIVSASVLIIHIVL